MKFKTLVLCLSYVVVAVLGGMLGRLSVESLPNSNASAVPERETSSQLKAFNLKDGEKVLIAHAGGAIGKDTYTNSLESVNDSAAKGFTYIELDFVGLHRGGDMVLLHDWQETYNKYFRSADAVAQKKFITLEDRPKTGAAFASIKMNNGQTALSLADFIEWMEQNPDIYIVVDVKGSKIANLTKIRDMLAGDTARFIAQIYSPSDYDAVRALGFKKIILTVYRLGAPLTISVEDLGDFCREKELFALTMPAGWFQEDTFARLGKTNTPLLLHTINDHEAAKRYFAAGVSGLYTDFITPQWVIENRNNF